MQNFEQIIRFYSGYLFCRNDSVISANACLMHQFILQHSCSPELQVCQGVNEFALKKISSLSVNLLPNKPLDCFCLYAIVDGKFNWIINVNQYTLYPGDLALVLPGDQVASVKGELEIGTVYWISFHIDQVWPIATSELNKEQQAVKKMVLLNSQSVLPKVPEVLHLLHQLREELFAQEIGFATRTNALIGEILIRLARRLSQQQTYQRDFPKSFMELELSLRRDLSHPWTVEEMAAGVGLGLSAFSDKVKNYTGFSPMNYLINIRISEAIKLLKKPEVPITSIALDTGFYSSQHFATTFKKITGFTPSEFRKNSSSNNDI